jgi:hypothetical protein
MGRSDHEHGPVSGAVEYKPTAGEPFVSYGPQHDRTIAFIKRVPCANEKESPILLSRVLVPYDLTGVYGALNTRFKA